MIIWDLKNIMFYKRSSFNGKIIRKFKYQDLRLALNGRYFSIKEREEKVLRIFDSSNMKI